MTKSLKTIQNLFKAGSIISKVFQIIYIIGLCICVLTGFTLYLGIMEPVKLNGITIYGLVTSIDSQTFGDAFFVCVKGAIACLGSAILSGIAYSTCKNELLSSNPFTFEGADELKKLGISYIVIPFVTNILLAAVHAVSITMFNANDINIFNLDVSLGMGIAFVILSVVCRYGAEVYTEKDTIIHEANLDQ